MVDYKLSIPKNLGTPLSFEEVASSSCLLVYNIDEQIIRLQSYTQKLIANDLVLGGIKLSYNTWSFINATLPFEYLIDGKTSRNLTEDVAYVRKAMDLSRTLEVADEDLLIGDEKGNVIMGLKGGHLRTKKFDSQNLLNISPTLDFIGDGDTYVRSVKKNVIPGHTYRVFVPYKWDYQSNAAKFVLSYFEGDKETVISYITTEQQISDYYDVDIPLSASEGVALCLGGRAESGEKKTVYVQDITNIGIEESTYEGEKIDLAERTYQMSRLFNLAHKANRQSIACFGKYMVSCHQFGDLYLYNIKNGQLICSAKMPVSEEVRNEIHGSNVSFSTEFAPDNTELPYLYVCETTGGRRCFVVNLKTNGQISLQQTIRFAGVFGNVNGNNYHDFLVDKENQEIVIVGYNDYMTSGDYTIVKRVPIHSATDGDINYTDEDVIDGFIIPEIVIIQGAFVFNNHLYIADHRNWIVNIDMNEKKVVGYVKLNHYTNELEGIAHYNGNMLVDIDGKIMKLLFN